MAKTRHLYHYHGTINYVIVIATFIIFRKTFCRGKMSTGTILDVRASCAPQRYLNRNQFVLCSRS
jgi:hypothetical protein